MRNPREIARRIIVLIGIFQAATGREKTKVVKILKDNGFWSDVSDYEKKFLLSSNENNTHEIIQLSWRAEAIYILLWVLHEVEFAEIPGNERNLDQIKTLLKEDEFYLEVDSKTAELRDPNEIHAMLDKIYQIHWEIRDAQIHQKEIMVPYHPSIIQEWHHSLNWVVKSDEDWDYITTDT